MQGCYCCHCITFLDNNLIVFYQALYILKNTDLKPYVVFVCPPNMEKLRQIQQRAGMTEIKVGRPFLRVLTQKLVFLFLNQNICCGTQKNRLNETVLLSIQNICYN